MKKIMYVVALSVMLCFTASVVMADPGPYDATMNVDGYDTTANPLALTPNEGSGSPEVYELINHLLGTGYTTNGETDILQVTSQNEIWQDLVGDGNAGDFAAIGISADNLNTIGVYNILDNIDVPVITDITGQTILGDGSLASPYPGGVNPFNAGESFGFYVESENQGSGVIERFDSVAAANDDGLDHMLAYHLPSLAGTTYYVKIGANPPSQITLTDQTYLLTWEDLMLNSPDWDSDYNDFSILVTRVAPVPEPLSMILFGSGLAAMAGFRRKKLN